MHTVAFLTQLLLLFLSVFLMIIVLLQRGRGGGLAGAFGGLGGQSAFGTKAGDMFTRITVVVATAWVLVAGGSGWFLRAAAESRSQALGDGAIVAPEDDLDNTPPAVPVAPGSSTPPDPAPPSAETPSAETPSAETPSQPPATETPSETPAAATPTEPATPPADPE